MRCGVSCSSTSFPWLVFFFGALLWRSIIHKHTGRWMWQGSASVISWSREKYSFSQCIVFAAKFIIQTLERGKQSHFQTKDSDLQPHEAYLLATFLYTWLLWPWRWGHCCGWRQKCGEGIHPHSGSCPSASRSAEPRARCTGGWSCFWKYRQENHTSRGSGHTNQQENKKSKCSDRSHKLQNYKTRVAMSLEYTPVTQSILCLIFLMCTATMCHQITVDKIKTIYSLWFWLSWHLKIRSRWTSLKRIARPLVRL